MSQTVRALPVSILDIKQKAASDNTQRQAMRNVQSKWSNRSPTGDLQQLFRRRDSLCVIDGCLMFGERVAVPKSLRLRVLCQFLTGHPGIGRMKSIARSYAYLPNMDQQIADLIKSCRQCQQAAKNPPKVPSVPWPQPQKTLVTDPYQLCGTDQRSLLPCATAMGFRKLQPPTMVHSSHRINSANSADNMLLPHAFPTLSSTVKLRGRKVCRPIEVSSVKIPWRRNYIRQQPSAFPALPNRQSTSEALMGRESRTTNSAMIPVQGNHLEPPSTKSTTPFEIGTAVDRGDDCTRARKSHVRRGRGQQYVVKASQPAPVEKMIYDIESPNQRPTGCAVRHFPAANTKRNASESGQRSVSSRPIITPKTEQSETTASNTAPSQPKVKGKRCW
ncbi:unnamed protein product [Mesocestoides corti]|uniref:Integrase_H2C2 domain-containing protein n=1 Tax=Mesocestoides corti TaxID=53468 RepID=A0A0R3UQ18_MESCO|nr:unnamed protein product [Mesocestoides corti]